MHSIETIYGTALALPVMPRAGQIIRFDALGRFLRVEDRVSNGLGTLYRMRSDGRAERYCF